jgi:hypothetical protein
MRLTLTRHDPNVRPYRASDLERCAELIERMSANVEWAMQWSHQELKAQLESPSFTTLVYEVDGKVQGLVNYHSFPLQGRELIRCAFIDLWAHDELNFAERVRLIGHLCARLREQGIHGVVAARSSTTPTSALVANLFVPGAQHFRIGIFPTKLTPELTPPKTWSFEIT